MTLDSAAERAGHELAAQPAVRASVEHTIADSYAAIGEYALAVEHYDDALTAARGGGVDIDEQARIALRRAEIIGNQGHLDEAVIDAGKAFALVESEACDEPHCGCSSKVVLQVSNPMRGKYEQCAATLSAHSGDPAQRVRR